MYSSPASGVDAERVVALDQRLVQLLERASSTEPVGGPARGRVSITPTSLPPGRRGVDADGEAVAVAQHDHLGGAELVELELGEAVADRAHHRVVGLAAVK